MNNPNRNYSNIRVGRIASAAVLIAVAALATFTTVAHARPLIVADSTTTPLQLAMLVDEEKTPRQPRPHPSHERDLASWSVALDNDILVPGTRDQDYTYGLSVSLTGADAARLWFSLDRPLGAIDDLLDLTHPSPQGITGHSLEAGLFGFTPEDVNVSTVQPDDRPYASLVYLSSSRVQVNSTNHVAWHTTLTLGMLGLPLVGEAQNAVHQIVGSQRAEGWDHQISDGGEPTARYAVARQRYLSPSSGNLELKSTVAISVGYLTEARWDLSFRYGRINSPWWRFNPDLARYGEGAADIGHAGSAAEHYLWGGIGVVARVWNAFLQGQFRDSDRSYAQDALNHGILEAWLGYTFAFDNGYRVSYVLRGHTSEVRTGVGDRNVLWGGVIIARTF